MFASRHVVCVGPGRLSRELRQVVLERTRTPLPDQATMAPRVLAVFETATEAERIAGQLQRAKLTAVVAGPEQPPTETQWLVATSLGSADGQTWVAHCATGESLSFTASQVTSLTNVDWRDGVSRTDRLLLINGAFTERPLLVHAERLVPSDGRLALLAQLVDAVLVAAPQARVRSRRMGPDDFAPFELTEDVRPLAVALVDALDTLPATLAGPIVKAGLTPRVLTPLSSTAAWLGWSLARGAGVLSFMTMVLAPFVSTTWGFTVGLVGLACSARNALIVRWHTSDQTAEVPSFPWPQTENGLAPRPAHWLADVLLLGLARVAMAQAPVPINVLSAVLGALGVCWLVWALVAAAQREAPPP